jgi:S-adenosyl methyltransferase
VLAHANQLLCGAPEGATSYIYGELREPGAIVRAAAGTLDFSRPVAVMLFGILHFFSDADDPLAVAGELVAALAPGSYLALSHLAGDVEGEALAETFRRLNAVMPSRSPCAAMTRWPGCSAGWSWWSRESCSSRSGGPRPEPRLGGRCRCGAEPLS